MHISINLNVLKAIEVQNIQLCDEYLCNIFVQQKTVRVNTEQCNYFYILLHVFQIQEMLHNKVQWMSGKVSKDFHQGVTQLVAGEVSSKKYMVAVKLKKKIMSPDWVNKIYDASRAS